MFAGFWSPTPTDRIEAAVDGAPHENVVRNLNHHDAVDGNAEIAEGGGLGLSAREPVEQVAARAAVVLLKALPYHSDNEVVGH